MGEITRGKAGRLSEDAALLGPRDCWVLNADARTPNAPASLIQQVNLTDRTSSNSPSS